MKLREYIRKMVNEELSEMARKSELYKLGNPEKVNALKTLHANTWIEDVINSVEEGGEQGVTRNDMSVVAGKGQTASIATLIKNLVKSGVLVKNV
mgnify:CR=1 FL=1